MSWTTLLLMGALLATPGGDEGVEGPAASDAAAPTSTPPAPRRGTDALIIGGAAAGVGLLANIGRMVLIKADCVDRDETPGCELLSQGPGYISLSILAPASNLTAAVLFGVGGSRRGVYEAYRATYHGEALRSGRGARISGATLLAVGLAGYVAVRTYSLIDGLGTASCGSTDSACWERRHVLYVAGIELTQATAAGGAGLLGYGLGLRKGRRSYGATALHPVLAPTFAGVGVSGTFF